LEKSRVKELVIETLDEIYLAIKYSFRDITVFPGEHLKNPFFISLGITIVSLICWLFGIFRMTDWIGGVVATIILGLLYYLGKEVHHDKPRDTSDSERDFELSTIGQESSSKKRKVSRREKYAKFFSDPIESDTENDSNS